MRICKFLKAYLLSTVICFVPCVLAQTQLKDDVGRCSDATVKLVGENFHLENFAYPEWGGTGNIVAGACKQWPSNQSKLITAFAYDSGEGGKVNDPFVYLLIAIVEKGQVVGSDKAQYYLQPGGIGNLKIDTAPYRLSSNVTAFGLDIKSGYSHNCGDGGTGAERTLYVHEGNVIRPILQIPAISSWHYIKGNQCGPTVDEEIIENIKLSIEVSGSATNGYRDLVITAKSSRTDGKPTGKGKFRHTLHYDGKEYSILGMEKPFHRWRTGREP